MPTASVNGVDLYWEELAKARHWSGSTSTAETCALGSHRSGTSPGVIAWSLATIVGIRHQPSQAPPVTTPKALRAVRSARVSLVR